MRNKFYYMIMVVMMMVVATGCKENVANDTVGVSYESVTTETDNFNTDGDVHVFCKTCDKDLTVAGESEEEHTKASGTYEVNVGGEIMHFTNCAGTYEKTVTTINETTSSDDNEDATSDTYMVNVGGTMMEFHE